MNFSDKKIFNLTYKELKDLIEEFSKAKNLGEKDENKSLKYMISDLEKTFEKVNPQFIAKLNTNNTIRRQIKSFTDLKADEDGKILDTINHTHSLIKRVQEKYNKKILSAKRADSRKNRLTEKSEVMRFYKNNLHQLKNFFDLLNILIDIKLHIKKRD